MDGAKEIFENDKVLCCRCFNSAVDAYCTPEITKVRFSEYTGDYIRKFKYYLKQIMNFNPLNYISFLANNLIKKNNSNIANCIDKTILSASILSDITKLMNEFSEDTAQICTYLITKYEGHILRMYTRGNWEITTSAGVIKYPTAYISIENKIYMPAISIFDMSLDEFKKMIRKSNEGYTDFVYKDKYNRSLQK